MIIKYHFLKQTYQLVPKNQGWFKNVYPHLKNDDFIRFFRIKRETLEMVLNKLDLKKNSGKPIEMKLAAVLYVLAHPTSFITAASKFGISSSALCSWINIICKAIIDKFGRSVKIPEIGSQEEMEMSSSFEELCGFFLMSKAF